MQARMGGHRAAGPGVNAPTTPSRHAQTVTGLTWMGTIAAVYETRATTVWPHEPWDAHEKRARLGELTTVHIALCLCGAPSIETTTRRLLLFKARMLLTVDSQLSPATIV